MKLDEETIMSVVSLWLKSQDGDLYNLRGLAEFFFEEWSTGTALIARPVGGPMATRKLGVYATKKVAKSVLAVIERFISTSWTIPVLLDLSGTGREFPVGPEIERMSTDWKGGSIYQPSKHYEWSGSGR